MDQLTHWNKAIDYIERHLREEVDIKKAASKALCSEYHFKRMFPFLSGVTFSEYIRRRRLSLAVTDLKETEQRIIDIALKYGYNSDDAFSRAFKQIHGISPSEARKESVSVLNFPRMTFYLTIQGGEAMKYRIVEKEPFKLVGFKKRVPIVFEGVNPDISKMNELLTPEAVVELKGYSSIEPKGIISASTNFSEGRMQEEGELDHYIGVAAETDTKTSYDQLIVDAGTWAVFEAVGPFPETLQNIWGRIYSEWFPSVGYESVNGPELLWHEHPDTSRPDYKSEIWIPVRKTN